VPKDPDITTNLTFHQAAAARGDGLDPRLAEALSKSGRVSESPANLAPTDPKNVIHVKFGRRAAEQTDTKGKTSWK